MTVRDGVLSTLGGMNQTIDSSNLRPDQYSRGINTSSRGGKPQTRPVFSKITIDDPLFTTGKFFGSKNYHLDSVDRLIVAIAGRVLGIDLSTLVVTDYTALAGVTMDTTVDRYYFQQADKYMIVQDSVNKPLIIDTLTATKASDTQVPIGTKMAYGHGRLFVVVPSVGAVENLGERFFVAGDIILPTDVSTVLKFTETTYLAEGGAFGMTNELGFITGLKFIRNTQSGQGLGSLVVLAQNGASAFAVQAPRANWKDIDISQVLFTNGGSKSPFGFIPVNNDLYYRSIDGIRSIGYSTATIAGSAALIANNPLSENVRPELDLDDEDEQYFASVQYIDDRIFTTVNADTDGIDTYFKGIISIDSSPISSFGAESSPIYDGIWTGLNFLQINKSVYNGRERLLAVSRDADGGNSLYYLNNDGHVDGSDSNPVCRLYTKAFNFTSPDDLKKFDYAHIYASDIRGSVALTMYYRPKGYPLWGTCATGSFRASYGDAGQLPQRIRRLRLTKTGSFQDTVNKLPLEIDIEFEFCIEWTGSATIDKVLFYAEEKTTGPDLACSKLGEAKVLEESDTTGVSLNDYEYLIGD